MQWDVCIEHASRNHFSHATEENEAWEREGHVFGVSIRLAVRKRLVPR